MKQLASRGKRFGGALIDSLLSVIIVIPVMIFLGIFVQIKERQRIFLGQQIGFFMFGILLFLALHGYLIAKHGQTIGKKIVGTKMVDLNGQLVPLGKIYFLRYFIVSLIIQMPLLGQLFALTDCLFIFRKDKRCIHDIIAGTQVVDI